jgi:hypothetical protein
VFLRKRYPRKGNRRERRSISNAIFESEGIKMGKDAKALFRKGVLCLWVVFGVTGFPGLMIAAKKGVPGPIVEKLANVFDQARISPGFQKYAKENYIF